MGVMKLRAAIKKELSRRFSQSKAKDYSIVITMKIDNRKLIIVPNWVCVDVKTFDNPNIFSVYTDLPNGRASIITMNAQSYDELVDNILSYDGLKSYEHDEKTLYYMSMAADYVAEYDMYEDEYRKSLEYANSKNDNEFEYEFEPYEDGTLPLC